MLGRDVTNGQWPTIRDDVAERAGVSTSPILLSMHDKLTARDDKHRRVQQAGEELGYPTNLAGLEAAGLSTVLIGAVKPARPTSEPPVVVAAAGSGGSAGRYGPRRPMRRASDRRLPDGRRTDVRRPYA